MPEASLSGTLLHYEEAGGGEPLLLLHGGLGTALLHWWRDIPVFATRYRVIAPDLRGYGRSAPPRTFPLDFYHRDAADLAELLPLIDAAPAHVVGWSDGAVVALVLAVEHPRLVRTLTVIGGEARLLPEERAAWSAIVDTGSWSAGAKQRFIDAQGPENWPDILQRMLDGYIAILDQRGGEITSARLAEIRCPTLILHGDADPTVLVQHAHEMHAAIAGSELHIYPGVGHLPQREQEADVHARILDFISRAGHPALE